MGALAVASVVNLGDPELAYQGEFNVQSESKRAFHYWIQYNHFPPKLPGYELHALGLNDRRLIDACSPLPSQTPSLARKIILMPLGSCWISEQINHLSEIGVKYIMFYLSADSPSYLYSDNGIIWGVVSNQQGQQWLTSLKKRRRVRLYFSENPPLGFLEWPNTLNGGKISTFSSWYPTNNLHVKPEIAAPGENILSTYPLDRGGYAVLSGTSMAAPYIAGALALYLEARGFRENANSLALRDILIATATPVTYEDFWSTSIDLTPVVQQGGGLINLFAAFNSTTRLNLSIIALNDTANFKRQVKFTIANKANATVSYQLSHVSSSLFFCF